MSSTVTPLMAQYHQIKAQYPDALLFFQVGDFYELFFDDAVTAARFLAITLTKRGKANGADIPLCGVPVHALPFYLTKLVKGGFSVALCDQRSKPQPGSVVERAVTKVYTPGTLTDALLLDERRPSYLCALVLREEGYEFLALELLTMHLFQTTRAADDLRGLEAELARFGPDEVLVSHRQHTLSALVKKWSYMVTPVAGEEVTARGLMEAYLRRVQPAALDHLAAATEYVPAQYVTLDAATQRNIALLAGSNGDGSAHSLCAAIDGTVTAMGARLLKKWLVRPLREERLIAERHEVVALFSADLTLLAGVTACLGQIADVERIVGRIVLLRATRADYLALKYSLTALVQLLLMLQDLRSYSSALAPIIEACGKYEELSDLLERSIFEGDGDFLIKSGYSEALDQARSLWQDGHRFIQQYAAAQAAATDISSLKVLYTSVSGYFIEVTKTHTHKVPPAYRHIQTLAGRDRFVTAELSGLERSLQQAAEEAQAREKTLYDEVEAAVRAHAGGLRRTAHALATLDALVGFARVAIRHQYVRPTFTGEQRIYIRSGRHAVVEQALGHQRFVANDTELTQAARLWVVTGPNMGGKSTYLRQVALIVLMAQCGSYVPAQSAELMIVDRIFTRIGAGDDVAQGKSTFLVEMEEAATICTQATAQSLVILDEVGRGTSTEDGRALAQAIIEYLCHTVGSLTLFATHYHELTALAAAQPGLANYHLVSVKRGDTLHFLHRIEPGVATASFGIDVAHLAQLPPVIIARARQLVNEGLGILPSPVEAQSTRAQPLITEAEERVCAQLRALDLDELSPRAAFALIQELANALR